MSIVGLIANPFAGKDIRRLVAHASTFDNHEKVNVLRRVLLGLDACGVREVVIMPDSFGIGERALDGLLLSLSARPLDFAPEYASSDSTRAAQQMRALGVRCIVTLGGDGTNRAVAKGCGDVPLLPISSGTNNVFPAMIEGTLAELAAGVVACGSVDTAQVIRRCSRLDIWRGETLIDLALVDVVAYRGQFTGSRAIWDTADLQQIITCRPEPRAIGFASVGGYLAPDALSRGQGIAIDVGGDAMQVRAPIAPGLILPVPIRAYHLLNAGEAVLVARPPVVLALDGERELVVRAGDCLTVRLSHDGPRVIDHDAALRLAASAGFFVRAA